MHDRQKRSDAEEAVRSKGEGVINRIKGNVKEAWGDITNDPEKQREGARDRIKGHIQEEYADTKQKESRLERDLNDIESGKV